MVNVDQLADEVLEFYSKRIDTNYRIGVMIVGPPGSGKSTVANQLRDTINRRYTQYMTEHSVSTLSDTSGLSNESLKTVKDLVSDIENMTNLQKEALHKNDGIFPEHVEDYSFTPVKSTVDNTVMVVGRGGIPNAIHISPPTLETIDRYDYIAEVIPMDGFHLTRKCLDQFVDPVTAHKRRGSPGTFDSNNFLQLMRIISKTMDINPPETTIDSSILGHIAQTCRYDLPDIFVPGFDHSLKDPSPDKYCIASPTRIVILEGLYLFHNEENWKDVYPTLEETGAIFPCYIEINLEDTEMRVAKRHLASGLVDTLEVGRKKFRDNDLLNAKLILQKKMKITGIHVIRND